MPSFSIKSQRLLKQLGVVAALERGERLALVGPTYALRKNAGIRVRLVFSRDPDQQLCVGYASDETGSWQPVDVEPFSVRALGYYQRRLKRVGERVEDA